MKKATKKKFMREPKMMTTEPSVDEVGMGMKKGGKTKKMAMGGNPMAGYPARPRARMTPSPAMGRSSMQQPMAMGSVPSSVMRKKGGEVESKAVHKAEMKKIGKVEKELKSHESMKASKAHKGLKMGGSSKYAKDNTPGGLLGGISATRSNKKGTTGGIELSKYKHGGKTSAKTGGIERSKYKSGGMVAGYKEGGHATMTCKKEGGFTQMKKMAKC